jgi:anti-anti-sigma factor
LLTVERTCEGERVRLSLQGELDLSNVATAELRLDEALAEGAPVLIDLSQLEFLDSTGIALLVRVLRQDAASRLAFLPTQTTAVRRLLGITGLDQRMPLAEMDGDRPVLPAA